ncbi:MAG: transglycosylase SLT domain-containing protein, partial [Treponema sp.]|nr:transglycosylase SLT domain-containing protein [Treponema sp.]
MKRILCIIMLAGSFFAAGAEELVSYQLDEAEHVELIAGEPIKRPLRQVRYAQPYVSRPHGEYPVSFTLTGFDEELTQKYIEQYSSRGGRNWLATIMRRSEPYLAFIRQEIERRGLPQELIYLPVIESAYSPTAVSRAGATGMWQFMR